jgi:F0F1-type ATP synthase assembly protein I
MANDNRNLLMQYAGFAMQLLVGIGIGVWFGMKLDQWMHIPVPVLVWLLPLLVIIATIIKAIKDTGNTKDKL